MGIALTVIALILLGAVMLLAVPVEITFDIENDEASRNEFALVWLSGLVRIPLRSQTSKKQPKKVTKKSPKKTGRRGQGKAWSLMRNASFRRRLFGYIRGLFRSIKIKTLDVQVRLGLDDPADTGRLWGVLGPLASLLAGIRNANIRVEPEFATEVFSLQSHGRISVIPLRVLWISSCFFLTPQVIGALVFKS